MDGTAFDRIAKAVGLNRRAALRALVGGLVTGAAITTGDSADAKKKCKGYGGKCTKSSECCANNCKYGYCRAGGGGNRKGTKCNTVTGTKYCDDGYACCKVAGYNVCIPKQACDTCANDDDWDCCSNGGGNQGLCPPASLAATPSTVASAARQGCTAARTAAAQTPWSVARTASASSPQHPVMSKASR